MFSRMLFTALGALTVSAWAQSLTDVAGPVTGFVFDAPSGAVRPMLGIPGAAYLGPAMAVGVTAASPAPDGSAVLAVAASGKLLIYTGLQNAAPTATTVSGAIGAPSRFAWSADASAAAIYSSASGQAQVISGLPKSPAPGAAIDLSTLPGPVTSLACEGQHVIAGVSGDSGGLFLASAQTAPQRIASSADPSAIVLAGSNLFFADSQSEQITQVESYAGTPAAVLFANDSSINAPAGLQVSSDGARLFAVNAGNRKLVVYEIASRLVLQSIGLSFAPTRLDRFGSPSVFLLNDTGNGPLYVVRDGGAGNAAVYFVPVRHRPMQSPIRRM